ncbi:MAG: substrate-binding domain-containing protein, partial [Miltoncostaeaceae bacterium]
RTLRNVALLSAAGLSLAASASAFGAATGSGATFPAIAYQTWCSDSGACSYTGVGSGSGIKALAAKTVDFAGSDVIMTDAQVATFGGANVTYIPTLYGAIAIPVKVSGVTGNKVKIDGSTLGDIFSGAITTWNDARITKTNKGIKFPAAPITVCVRSDASGTSGNFSNYLSKVSASYKAKVSSGGQNQTPAWTAPALQSASGNAGVANCVNSNDNAIGYVDLGDAIRAGLQSNVVAVGEKRIVKGKGRVMQYVLPSTKTIQLGGTPTAAQNVKIKAGDLKIDFTASPNSGSYPITTTTFILVRAGMPNNGAVSAALSYFLGKTAQSKLEGLGFVALSGQLRTGANKALANLG